MSDLEAALDELYGVDLDSFIAARERLSKELRSSGSLADAKTLGSTKKPVLAAWVINQLTRRKRRDIDLLLDAGHRLRQAQEQLLKQGDREAFDDARRAEQTALERLTKAARELLKTERGSATPAVLEQVNETLRAAVVSPNGREVLARGRLTQPMQGEGFEPLSTVNLPTPSTRRKRMNTAALSAARAALKAARQDQRATEQKRQSAEREAEKAKQLWKQADQRAETARRTAVEASEVAAAAQRDHDKLARRRKPNRK